MLRYILSSQYREAYKFLSSAGLLEETSIFQMENFKQVRKIFETSTQLKKLTFQIKCFKVLEEAKKYPITMINVLMFIHLMLQNLSHITNETIGLMQNQINTILENSHKYRSKTLQNVDQKIKPCLIIKTEAQDEFIQSPMFRQYSKALKQQSTQTPSPLKFETHQKIQSSSRLFPPLSNLPYASCKNIPQKQPQNRYKKFMFSNIKQFLCEKLIQPYACYLLKRATTNILSSCQLQETYLQQHQQICAWNIINIYKLLFKATDNFEQIIRYYNKNEKYSRLLVHLLEIFDHDIKHSYPKLVKIIIKKLRENQTEIKHEEEYYQQNHEFVIDNEIENVEEMYQKRANLSQMKQILNEISWINQKMKVIYLGKYFFNKLKSLNIRIPKILTVQNEYCQYVFYKQAETSRKIKKSQSLRRQRKLQSEILNQYPAKSQHLLKLPEQTYFFKNNNIISIKEQKNEDDKENQSINDYRKFKDASQASTEISKSKISREFPVTKRTSIDDDQIEIKM